MFDIYVCVQFFCCRGGKGDGPRGWALVGGGRGDRTHWCQALACHPA